MKQQEYQEALDILRRICLSIPALAQGDEMGYSEDFDFNHDGYEDECDTIQQLIDKLPYWLELEEKDKPTKPLQYCYNHVAGEKITDFRCGKCTNWLTNDSFEEYEIYCSNCGRRLDWSDEE